jgi:cell division septal protein FtsQ
MMALAAPSDPILLARRRALSQARGRRRLTLICCVLGLVASLAGYQVLKASSVFAVKSVVVHGGSPALDAQVQAQMQQAVAGRSLLAVNTAPLTRTLEQMAYVRAARVDRAFPNTLSVTLAVERPVAVAASGHSAWLVSGDGRILGTTTAAAAHLPKVVLPGGLTLATGSLSRQANLATALRTLHLTPDWFRRQVGPITEIVPGTSSLTLVVNGRLQVRLGSIEQLSLKLRVAARWLGTMPASDRASVLYVDVSAPATPALKYKK